MRVLWRLTAGICVHDTYYAQCMSYKGLPWERGDLNSEQCRINGQFFMERFFLLYGRSTRSQLVRHAESPPWGTSRSAMEKMILSSSFSNLYGPQICLINGRVSWRARRKRNLFYLQTAVLCALGAWYPLLLVSRSLASRLRPCVCPAGGTTKTQLLQMHAFVWRRALLRVCMRLMSCFFFE